MGINICSKESWTEHAAASRDTYASNLREDCRRSKVLQIFTHSRKSLHPKGYGKTWVRYPSCDRPADRKLASGLLDAIGNGVRVPLLIPPITTEADLTCRSYSCSTSGRICHRQTWRVLLPSNLCTGSIAPYPNAPGSWITGILSVILLVFLKLSQCVPRFARRV